MNTKKGLSAVIATSLLVLVAISAVVSFSMFYDTFSSNLFANTENQARADLQIRDATRDIIYIYSSSENQEVHLLRINEINGPTICEFDNSYTNSGLVAHWRFENRNSTHLFDDSDSQFHARFFGTNNIFRGGVVGQSYYVENSSGGAGFARVLDETSLDFGTNDFTILTWVRADEMSNWMRIFDKRHEATQTGYACYSNGLNTNLRCFFSTGTPNHAFTYSDLVIFDGRWSHLTFRVDRTNSSAHAYKNSIQSDFVFDISSQVGSISNSQGFQITGNTFQGYVDEMIVFNRSLSDNEIRNIYYFNSNEIYLTKGISQIPIYGCQLEMNRPYRFFIATNLQSTSGEFFIN